MGKLRVHLFGTLRIAREGGSTEIRTTRACQVLLAYLLLHRRLHSRKALCGVFWGDLDEGRARSCLRTTLWRLRQVLERDGAEGAPCLEITPSKEVGLSELGDHWIDVREFEAAVKSASTRPFHTLSRKEVQGLEEALGLYVGDLLEGFEQEWILVERERLRCLYLATLTCLMRYHGYHGEYEKSAELAQDILKHDPLREDVHRYLMRLHVESGQRPAALQQYRMCLDVLRKELGIEPMGETRKLYAEIARGSGQGFEPSAAVGEPAGFQQALRELSSAMEGFDQAHTVLRGAVERVERLIARRQKSQRSV